MHKVNIIEKIAKIKLIVTEFLFPNFAGKVVLSESKSLRSPIRFLADIKQKSISEKRAASEETVCVNKKYTEKNCNKAVSPRRRKENSPQGSRFFSVYKYETNTNNVTKTNE
jgi:hypothetical protein